MKVFENRHEAGRELASALRARGVGSGERAVVLAIPRGGLPVAAEVARALDLPLDVVVVRKLRTPHNPELGFGAVGPGDHMELDEDLVERLGITPEQVDEEVADRRQAVARRLGMYRRWLDPVDLAGATAIVVDDGIATGGTAMQALSMARSAGAERVVLAVPTAPPGTQETFAGAADDVLVLSTPAEFLAVGQAYREFAQLDDEAALASVTSAGTGTSAEPSGGT